MAFLQLRELVQTMARLHSDLASQYDDVADEADDLDVRRFAHTFAAREHEHAARLLDYLQASQDPVLETWVQVPPARKVHDDKPSQDVGSLARWAAEQAQENERFYGQLAGQSGTDRLKRLAKSLEDEFHTIGREITWATRKNPQASAP